MPESSRAASIGATANAPCREGAANSSTGERLLLIESAAEERRPATSDSARTPEACAQLRYAPEVQITYAGLLDHQTELVLLVDPVLRESAGTNVVSGESPDF